MNKIEKIELILSSGYEKLKNSQFKDALLDFKKALNMNEKNSKTLFLIGITFGSLNNHLEAKNYFYKALKIDPDNYLINYNLAKALSETNNDEESIKFHEKAVKLEPNKYESWLNYSISLKKLSIFDEAKDKIKKALDLNNNSTEIFINYGDIYFQNDEFENAKNMYLKALSIKSNDPNALNNIGNVYFKQNQFNESIDYYKKAIKSKSDFAEVYSNISAVYRRKFNFSEAIKYVNLAIEKKPKLKSAWSNKGLIECNNGLYEDAKKSFLKAITLSKENSEACVNLGQLELANENFKNGWLYYEKRWKTKNLKNKYIKTDKEEWDGKKRGESLLIVNEQGIGDQILYASMIKETYKYFNKIYIICDYKLKKLFTNSFNNCSIIISNDFNYNNPGDFFEYHIPLGNLGKFFRNDKQKFNSVIFPYILDSKKITSKLKDFIKEDKKIVCGISWKSINKNVGKEKSIELDDLKQILNNQNIKFINLQYGNFSEELNKFNNDNKNKIYQLPKINLTEDLLSLASIIKNCDFVLTVSNSNAHLAAALNSNVLLMVPYSIGKLHYWTLKNEKSPWYPSIKIFRQENKNSWEKTINFVNEYINNNILKKN